MPEQPPEPTLSEEDVAGDPFGQWSRWWDDALTGEREPEAMSLATVAPDGTPQVRFVLLKDVDGRGWVFYTNERSAKGRALEAHPVAALALRWAVADRQVRVAGPVERVGADVADAYFASRARRSQLGAWASAQSEVIDARTVLEERMARVARRFEGREVPRPAWWGGFRVVPDSVEYWQGRPNRLHDRLRYTRAGVGWRIERLSP